MQLLALHVDQTVISELGVGDMPVTINKTQLTSRDLSTG